MNKHIAYFDLIGGASGNMILGALLDAGLDGEQLRAALAALNIPGWSLEIQRVTRRGISATLVEIRIHDERTERHLSDLIAVIDASSLSPHVKETSTRILTRLAEIEARIHDQPIAEVHLHELGGLDTIIDIVGAVAGLEILGIAQIVVSPFPLARGQIETAHGIFPLPAPATVALLERAPILGIAGERETVTPTAAAILTTLAHDYGALPRMTLRAIGYGAGSRDDPTPNVLRVMIGASPPSPSLPLPPLLGLKFSPGEGEGGWGVRGEVVQLETNIDDMNPQLYDHLIERLFTAGALDVTLTPMQMKKNRPATCLRVLAPVDRANELRTIIFNETTTLGVREQILQRYTLPREIISVEAEYGTIRVKIARRPNGTLTVAPEYDDCARAAREHNVPIQTVMEAVKKNL